MEAASRHDLLGKGAVTAPAELPVLIVHADRHVRSYLRMLLVGLHMTNVVEATNSVEVRKICREIPPSIALLDVDVPDGSIEINLRTFGASHPAVELMAVTKHNGPEVDKVLVACGVLGHIPIQVVREEITERLRAALARLRAKDLNVCRLSA